jgi:hypothetical protein
VVQAEYDFDPRSLGIVMRTLDVQGAMQPGTEGYWQVWGAVAADLQKGDLFIAKFPDGEVLQDQVNEIVHEDNLFDYTRKRYINQDGQDRAVGLLVRVWVFRRGTHHILSPHVR